MAKKLTPEDLDAFVRQIKLIGLGLILLFLALIGYAIYVGGRLENPLKPSLPAELEADDGARDPVNRLEAAPTVGQVVYVPAYSHVYHSASAAYQLTITLSVRNTSTDSEIVVESIRYFDTKGKEVRAYLDKPARLPALGTTEVVIEGDDSSGGSGANFLVEWSAKRPVTEPIIEAVMIAAGKQQGISFVTRGTAISVALPGPEAATPPK